MNAVSVKRMVPLISGLLFAVGLGLGGMTEPRKVTAFLDLFGHWDPSLMFVMGGAIMVHMPVVLWLRRKNAAADSIAAVQGCGVVEPAMKHKLFDVKLVGGAAVFGVGWGLGGFCPGPGLASVGAGSVSALAFVIGMAVAMVLYAMVGEPHAKYKLPSWLRLPTR